MLDGLDQQKTTSPLWPSGWAARSGRSSQLAKMAAYARKPRPIRKLRSETRLAAVHILGRSGTRAGRSGHRRSGRFAVAADARRLAGRSCLGAWASSAAKSRRRAASRVAQRRPGACARAFSTRSSAATIGRPPCSTTSRRSRSTCHEIDIGRRQQLASLKNRALAARAEQLLAASVDKRPVKVIGQLSRGPDDCTAMPGMAANSSRRRAPSATGSTTSGHSIGPELVALTDKSPQALLVAILDPESGRRTEIRGLHGGRPNQGRQYTGILAAETGSSITLLQQENKQTTILRGELEELSAPASR